MTERLYDQDPYLKEFTARVVRKTDRGVVLDRTAFFPTGGGQPCDFGTLNGHDVTDVVDEGGDVLHVVAEEVVGEVHGLIDWERRRDHMQQHHGQHLLSEAFVRVAGAATSSFHLGEDESTIDLDKAVGPIDVERAEALANMVVVENRAVKVGLHTPEEAKALPLRKPPPAGETRIRVIQVGDFDTQACCGTHPRSTGEVGVIQVTDVEKGKDGSRVRFVCGFRALKEARENARVVRELGRKLSVPRVALEMALERVLADSADARKALNAAERALAGHAGRELAARGKIVVEAFPGKGLEYIRVVATELVKTPGKVAVMGGAEALVLARSADVDLDLRPVFKEAVALIQGKGGGSAMFVQGGGPGKDVAAALKLAEGLIRAALV
ncbi:MAG TPA: alanine--tRNA ligase-related protein [Planctomycetota bacterium]